MSPVRGRSFPKCSRGRRRLKKIDGDVFKFLLVLENGEPHDPAVFVSVIPNWSVGETFSTGRGHEWRILAIETEIDDELVEHGVNAVLTVELA
jgi:hypothetical protein